ncbi:MAG TPA: hypothetical protein PLB02_04035 [Thermoanaerobaculia bacterium]|nr:hypothetical protein [Thermoanaerobaculia bacterium]
MATAKPGLRFLLSPALRTRTSKVLAAIDKGTNTSSHAEALCALVMSLTEAGFDYYFLKPLKDAKFGFVARQTASLGVAGAMRVMSPILLSVLGSATPEQLRGISKHIRTLMA